MNILYVNPIGNNILLFVIKKGSLVKEIVLESRINFENFPEKVVEVVESEDIEELWCICWPGQFTRMRIVTLTLSTIAYIERIPIKWCHFFDVIWDENPIIKANEREYIVRWTSTTSTLIEKDLLHPWVYTGYGEIIHDSDKIIILQYADNMKKIVDVFSYIAPMENLVPIYLKEPHIT